MNLAGRGGSSRVGHERRAGEARGRLARAASTQRMRRTEVAETVLVVDDDQEVRDLIADFLEAQGYRVLRSADGFDALAQIERARPSAVVLDLNMPRLGGLETLRRARAFHPSLTVVTVTGMSDPHLREEALTLGASAFLTKPLDLGALLAALRAPRISRGSAVGCDGPPERVAGKILIVDDDPEICRVLEELLETHGYSACAVADAAAAFWALMKEMPDVVLLDIALPGLSGVDLIPAIRSVSRTLPIIMVSGITDVELAKRALAYGAFDYVTKPVDVPYLLRSLEAALASKRLGAWIQGVMP